MPPNRFIALDSLRGICAVMVVIYHFSATSYVSAIPFVKNGFLFVDFFFVLSGFVIASSYGEKLRGGFSIARFMFLRLGRLYPLHIFVLLLYVPIAIAGGYSLPSFWTTALLLQAFSDGNLGNWNPPSWSISAEIWAYLVFAFLCRVSGSALPWLLGAMIAAAPPILLWTSDRYLDVCFEGALVRCLFGFAMGALAFMYLSNHDRPAVSAKTFTFIELSAVTISLLMVSIAGAGPLSFLCPPVFVATILVFACEGGAVSRLLKKHAITLVGTLSYSIYMTHLFVQARLLNLIGLLSRYIWLPISKEIGGVQTISGNVAFAADAAVIIMIAIVIGIAYLTFKFIEEPGRRWSRGDYASLARARRGSLPRSQS